MCKIKVIDSIMGSGKTTWAISEISDNPQNNYVYITPYLEEIKRMRQHTPMYEPKFTSGGNKKADFHNLLSQGKNICSTHSLFTKADDTTREALRGNNYILILDEVMNVISELDNFTGDDLELILNEKLAYIEDDFLMWNNDKLDYNGRYTDIKYMALNKNLIVIGNKLVYWNFPVDIFKYFDEVYILTYLFKAQIQKYYYDFHNVKYTYHQIKDNQLIEYDKELAQRRIAEIKPLIKIYEGKYNSIGEKKFSLSKTWFEKDEKYNNHILSDIIKTNLYNYFNNENRKVVSKNKLWCTFKNQKTRLQGKGYTKRFIAINMRATNDYRETSTLAYCCNRFLSPSTKIFFSKRNIKIDEDLWATSELIQWVWRSRIRENNHIYVYIPSERMRENLRLFLDNKS